MTDKTKKYEVYKGKELLFSGTSKECAEFLGVKQSTIYWHTTEAAVKRRESRKFPEHCLSIVKLGRNGDDE